MLPLAFRDFFHSRIGSFSREKRMDLETPSRSRNQLVRATFQGSSFRSFALPPGGSAVVSLPAFDGASQVPLFLPSVFLPLAGEETLDVI